MLAFTSCERSGPEARALRRVAAELNEALEGTSMRLLLSLEPLKEVVFELAVEEEARTPVPLAASRLEDLRVMPMVRGRPESTCQCQTDRAWLVSARERTIDRARQS